MNGFQLRELILSISLQLNAYHTVQTWYFIFFKHQMFDQTYSNTRSSLQIIQLNHLGLIGIWFVTKRWWSVLWFVLPFALVTNFLLVCALQFCKANDTEFWAFLNTSKFLPTSRKSATNSNGSTNHNLSAFSNNDDAIPVPPKSVLFDLYLYDSPT